MRLRTLALQDEGALFAAVSVALHSLLIGRTALHACLWMSVLHWTLTLRSSASRQQWMPCTQKFQPSRRVPHGSTWLPRVHVSCQTWILVNRPIWPSFCFIAGADTRSGL